MDLRKKELLDLRTFTQNIDTEVTMLLQSLQWDRKRLVEGSSAATCHYDVNHRMPKDNLGIHERSCVLRSLGYLENEELLPDPPDDKAHTLVKLSNIEIERIINDASRMDPLFKKVMKCSRFFIDWLGLNGGVSHQPLSLSRLQLVYTADERRALHDAVVAAVPSCHDLGDLALASSTEDAQKGSVAKSRVEILAELRNMKRRRAKYRVAAKTKNYSDVLRDVIKTQMESYTEAIATTSFKVEDNTKYNHVNNSDYDRNKSRSNTVNDKSKKNDSGQSRDRSDDRRENLVAEKRRNDSHYEERRYREEDRRESYSRRYNDCDRSDSRKRNESHRQKSHKDDNMSSEGYKSISGQSDRFEGNGSYRRHDDKHKDKIRSEGENGQRYKLQKDKTKSHVYKEFDDRYSGSKYEEENYRTKKIKVEPDEHRQSRSKEHYDRKRSERRSSRDRYESRKRKHRHDDNRRQGEEICDAQYKRFHEIKKEPS